MNERDTDPHDYGDPGPASDADPGRDSEADADARSGARSESTGDPSNEAVPSSRGVAAFQRVLGREPNTDKPMRGVRELSYSHLFPRVWNRPGLPLRERSLVTVALLAAQGREGQLRAHLKGAKSRGIPLEEIIEVMVQVAHYAGWPAGMFGQVTAEAVYAEGDAGG